MNRKNWRPPKDAAKFFSPSADRAFQKRHKVLYVLGVIAIVVIAVAPAVVFLRLVPQTNRSQILAALFGMIGVVGSLSVSVAIANVFMLLRRQYLGHWVTILFLMAGAALCAFSLWMLSIV